MADSRAQMEYELEQLYDSHTVLEEAIEKIRFIFEEKIKTSEANIAQLTKHRDRAYASGHLTESYDRELARWQEKHDTLTALWQEIQGSRNRHTARSDL